MSYDIATSQVNEVLKLWRVQNIKDQTHGR